MRLAELSRGKAPRPTISESGRAEDVLPFCYPHSLVQVTKGKNV